MKRPAPRPQRLGHVATRERILDAARTVLREQGFDRLALREVARGAGLSPASLYEYFDGLDALVTALASESAARLRLALERSLEDAPDEPLVALGLAYVKQATKDPEGFQLLFARLPSGRASFEEPVPEASPYGVVVREVGRAIAKGALRPARGLDPERIAYGLWCFAHGMASLRLTHLAGFAADFDAADRELLRAFVRGLSA